MKFKSQLIKQIYPAYTYKNEKPLNYNIRDRKLFIREENAKIEACNLYHIKDMVLYSWLFRLYETVVYTEINALFKLIIEKPFISKISITLRLFKLLFKRKSKNIKTVDHSIVIVSRWAGEYYHWIADELPKIILAQKELSYIPNLRLTLPIETKNKQYISKCLSNINLMVDYYAPDAPVKIKNAYYLDLHGYYNKEALHSTKAFLLDLVQKKETFPAKNQFKIYIARKKNPRRFIINENEVKNTLENLGFQTLYAEELSFTEQIKIFKNTSCLIGLHGAGLANMIVLQENCKVLELRNKSDMTNNCYYSMANALGLKYFYLLCELKNFIKMTHIGKFWVNPEKLKSTVEKHLC